MSGTWGRARVGFLQVAAIMMLVGAIVAVSGLAEGEPAMAPFGFGGMGLIVGALLLIVDRLFPGLRRGERRMLFHALWIGTVVYFAAAALGENDVVGHGVLAVAAVPGLLTGGAAIGLAVHRKE